MSSGGSPPLSSLVLGDDEGASPWGDEFQRSANTSTPPITLPEDNGFKDSANTSEQQHETSQPTPAKSTAASRRMPRRPGRQVVRAEVIDDTLGPLGPLGDTPSEPSTPDIASANQSQYEIPPCPPVKEAGGRSSSRGATSSGTATASRQHTMESVSLEDEEAEARRNNTAGSFDSPQEQQLQPVKPMFEVSVGDPHKVGDLTSAHTVYQVRTKTSSKAFRVPEFTVTRRYRDFLWLYDILNINNPGVVVPPPPEKQAVGRFDENFVETRRAALERMVNRICQHPILLQDNDLKLFLESESLSNDIKHRIHNPPLQTESKGMFGFGSFTTTTKFIETDDFFNDRRQYLDALEIQLKTLLKAVDGVVRQRKDLSEAASDFSSSLHALSTVELSKALSSPLANLSELQIRIKELHERQALQDILTLGITVDEYIRIIGSIKRAFEQRQKAYSSYNASESELVKKRLGLEKLQRQGKTQQDRLTQLTAEVADCERKVQRARVLFDDMGRLLRSELDRFEREKVEDFKSGVETFLESAVEAQKELIELWESYLVQLDREEENDAANGDSQPQVQKSPKPVESQESEETEEREEREDREDEGVSAA